MDDFHDHFEPHGRGTQLVVVLHGYTLSSAAMKGMAEVIHSALPDADRYIPDLPYSRWNATTPLAAIVAELTARVGRLCDRRSDEQTGRVNRPYDEIILVGHSTGAVVARKLVVAAWGVAGDVTGADGKPMPAQPWAARISRLIFIAGVNRGWGISSALSWLEVFTWRLGTFIGRTVYRNRATVFDTRRGAPFLVETRLQWLALMRGQGAGRPNLTTIQLLGTVDDLVAPDDAVDFAIDAIEGHEFFMIELPQTGHLDAIEMRVPRGEKDAAVEGIRGGLMALALAGDLPALRAASIDRAHLDETQAPPPEPDVKDVVFVIHGIRDRGYWTHKVARKIKEAAAREGRQFRSVTGTYGYFPMVPFLFPSQRREKVEWLMDLYTETRAQFPNAEFSYVGHSNGTYLLARALRDYPSARFKHVVFAGSVVRSDYDWGTLLGENRAGLPRVERLLNYVASADWVVAIFPKGLEPIRAIDLGAAGYDGFRLAESYPDKISQFEFIKGSHGAGIKESQWDDIAAFIVNGTTPPDEKLASDEDFVKVQGTKLRLASALAPAILVAVVLLVVSAVWLLLRALPINEPGGVGATLVTLTILAYLWLLRFVGMRV